MILKSWFSASIWLVISVPFVITTAESATQIPRVRETIVSTHRFRKRNRFLHAIAFNGSLLCLLLFLSADTFSIYCIDSTGESFPIFRITPAAPRNVTSIPKQTDAASIQGRNAIIAEAFPRPCRYILESNAGIPVKVNAIPATLPQRHPRTAILKIWRYAMLRICRPVVPRVFNSPNLRISFP